MWARITRLRQSAGCTDLWSISELYEAGAAEMFGRPARPAHRRGRCAGSARDRDLRARRVKESRFYVLFSRNRRCVCVCAHMLIRSLAWLLLV